MENKILSIVVPSYNAEKFLKKGIPTFLDERIKNDIEVIIVDDGSTDNTALIADEFAANNPECVTVVHKKNGGHGSTINSGITVAKGEYFAVVDADDWVDTNNFICLVNTIKKNMQIDMFLANCAVVDEKGVIFSHENIEGVPANIELNVSEYFQKIPRLLMHNYFIKTSILRENNVTCHEHHFYVDLEFVFYSVLYAKKVMFLEFDVYQYLSGREGQSVSISSRQKNLVQYKEVSEFLSLFYSQKRDEIVPNLRKFYAINISAFIGGYYSTLLSFKVSSKYKKEMVRFDNWLKEISSDIYKANNYFTITLLRKTKFVVYPVFAFLFKIAKKIVR